MSLNEPILKDVTRSVDLILSFSWRQHCQLVAWYATRCQIPWNALVFIQFGNFRNQLIVGVQDFHVARVPYNHNFCVGHSIQFIRYVYDLSMTELLTLRLVRSNSKLQVKYAMQSLAIVSSKKSNPKKYEPRLLECFLQISPASNSVYFIQFLSDGPANAPVLHNFQFLHADSKNSQNISPLLRRKDLPMKQSSPECTRKKDVSPSTAHNCTSEQIFCVQMLKNS